MLQKNTYSGYLWDTTAGIELKNVSLQESPQTNGNGKHTYLQPYIAHFKVNKTQSLLHLLRLNHTIKLCMFKLLVCTGNQVYYIQNRLSIICLLGTLTLFGCMWVHKYFQCYSETFLSKKLQGITPVLRRGAIYSVIL